MKTFNQSKECSEISRVALREYMADWFDIFVQWASGLDVGSSLEADTGPEAERGSCSAARTSADLSHCLPATEQPAEQWLGKQSADRVSRVNHI